MRASICLPIALLGASACGDSAPECTVDPSYDPPIRPADFATPRANPLWPLVPGTVWVFHGGGERVEVTVTSDRREILGVSTVVVRDTVTVGGKVIEDTYDWFVADNAGNVWYFGEDTTDEDGSKGGSWEAGVDGAKPGIVMHATQPSIGTPYRQEYLPCEAEDMGQVVSLSESVTVPFGTFDGCLQTFDYTPLEPDAREHKFYCPGIGAVLEVDLNSGERLELTEMTRP